MLPPKALNVLTDAAICGQHFLIVCRYPDGRGYLAGKDCLPKILGLAYGKRPAFFLKVLPFFFGQPCLDNASPVGCVVHFFHSYRCHSFQKFSFLKFLLSLIADWSQNVSSQRKFFYFFQKTPFTNSRLAVPKYKQFIKNL